AARDLLDRLIAGQPVGNARRHPAAPGLDPTGHLTTAVGRVESSAIEATRALQLARDALEDSMALGTTRPLTSIRQGEIVLLTSGASHHIATRVRMARRRAHDEHDVDVRYGMSTAPGGFPAMPRAYREASLTLSYTSADRAVVSLDELSALECALVSADSTTRALIASKGRELNALAAEERATAVTTVQAFAASDMNIARAAQQLYVHPNTVRYRLARIAERTGHDPRTFSGLLDLICVLDTRGPQAP
ncbi:MAG: hypothetical protein QOJ85_2345, partial [Solirubrobacteraceae bacterium]|nr:hypothetical protein [Solirubrobacteraceae bacterium]